MRFAQLISRVIGHPLGVKPANSGMWINDKGAARAIAGTTCSKVAKTALRDLATTGLAIIPGNVMVDRCDAVLADFEAYCAAHPEHRDFSDAFGLHDRLANLPLVSAAARTLALDPVVLEVVETAFRAKADIVGSLYFERGSGQNIHRDTPAFYTLPLNHYFGVWHALEDIHPDSGALTYYPGGHRIAPDHLFVGSGRVDEYFHDVEAACRAEGLTRERVLARKGDTIIWHPELPHGGSEILDASRSRRSIVYHYKQTGLPIFGAAGFFGDQSALSREDNLRYIDIGGRRYVDHIEPQFFLNRKEGNFKEQMAKGETG